MKKLYTYFCLFLPLVLWSQAYVPLLNNQNEWHFTTCFAGDCLTDVYFTNGDTIVEGQNYKILDGYHYISRTFLLRENLIEKKVHMAIITPNRINTYLLYDFSLEVGDTFDMKNPITPFPTEAGLFVLDAIVEEPIFENETRRHFYFSPHVSNTISTNTAVWVEGVGSLSLINAASGFPDQNGVGLLNCFFKDGTLFYTNLNEQVSSCNATLEASNFSFPDILAYFPDKKGYCHITNTSVIKEIEVYDLLGRKVLRQTNKNQENSMILDFNPFQKGVYILHLLTTDERQHSIKISY